MNTTTAAANSTQQRQPRGRRVPTFTTDENNRAVALVPLPGGKGQVRILRHDFRRITKTLGASDQWQANDNGTGVIYIRVRLPEKLPEGIDYVRDAFSSRQTHAVIARLVLKVPPSKVVRYRDGNRLNLLPENLYVEEDDSNRPGKKADNPLNVEKFAESVRRFDPS